jgi:hypothetical protein
MRLWSIHPSYLDAKGLVALWREALLAQKVLKGLTKGYKHHPQLSRFKTQQNPVSAINAYLAFVFAEAEVRGYHFNSQKFSRIKKPLKIPVTQGQLAFEYGHLLKKLKNRHPESYKRLKENTEIVCHPLFKVIKGIKEVFEK